MVAYYFYWLENKQRSAKSVLRLLSRADLDDWIRKGEEKWRNLELAWWNSGTFLAYRNESHLLDTEFYDEHEVILLFLGIFTFCHGHGDWGGEGGRLNDPLTEASNTMHHFFEKGAKISSSVILLWWKIELHRFLLAEFFHQWLLNRLCGGLQSLEIVLSYTV